MLQKRYEYEYKKTKLELKLNLDMKNIIPNEKNMKKKTEKRMPLSVAVTSNRIK